MSPRDIDELTMPEFGMLAGMTGKIDRRRVLDMATAGRLSQAKNEDWRKVSRELSEG